MTIELPFYIDQLRDALRRFTAKHMPREEAARWDKENIFPRAVFDELAAVGVMGSTIPEEYGGTGRDTLATLVTIEELSRRSLAISVPYIMCACYAGMNILECGSERQRAEFLPLIAAGKLIFAYGWTEADTGADLASVRTTGRIEGDRIVVNGSKRFCSGSEICDYIYTLIRTGEPGDRYNNLSIVLIPPDSPGVAIHPINSMGMKGARTTDVSFTDVEVPLDNIVGGMDGYNRGWSMITSTGLDVEKLEVAAIALGIAEAACDDAWEYSETRKQFGTTISTFQSIRHQLAEMKTQLHVARLATYHAAMLSDRNVPRRVETSMTKLFVTEAAKKVVLDAQSIFGAYGYVRDFDIERNVRDVLLMPIIGGSSAVQRNNIANWLGLAR